jgi:hypothetical protein
MFLGNKVRVEILLPLFDNDGNIIDKSKLFETRRELVAEFKGCTFLGAPTQGMWIDNEVADFTTVSVTDKNPDLSVSNRISRLANIISYNYLIILLIKGLA